MTYHKIMYHSDDFHFSMHSQVQQLATPSLLDHYKIVKLSDVIQQNTHLIFSMHCTAIFLTSWSAYVKSSSSKACSGSNLAMGHVWSRICIWKHFILNYFWYFTADLHLYILRRLFLAFHHHHHHHHLSVLQVENWAVGSLTPGCSVLHKIGSLLAY